MGTEKVTGEIDIDNSPPPSLVSLKEVKHWAYQTGVVHEDLNLSQFRLNLIEHLIYVFGVGDISGNGYG